MSVVSISVKDREREITRIIESDGGDIIPSGRQDKVSADSGFQSDLGSYHCSLNVLGPNQALYI